MPFSLPPLSPTLLLPPPHSLILHSLPSLPSLLSSLLPCLNMRGVHGVPARAERASLYTNQSKGNQLVELPKPPSLSSLPCSLALSPSLLLFTSHFFPPQSFPLPISLNMKGMQGVLRGWRGPAFTEKKQQKTTD